MSQADSGTDARVCERITREHARTFTLASHFLPSPKRRAAFAVYAFCRAADDLVDGALAGARDVAAHLATYQARLDVALAGAPDDAIFRELAWAVRTYGIPDQVLAELLAGIARDLEPVRHSSWPDLERYCVGVASTVGVMCTHIFGVIGNDGTRGRALAHAATLGVAMQLTNVLRDAGEDLARGRCYFPADELARFGLSAELLLAGRVGGRDPRWRALMQFEIARARRLYAEAHPGIALLERDARRCATACALGYARILDAIERNRYDTLSRRARVGAAGKLRTLWSVWRLQAPRPPALLPA